MKHSQKITLLVSVAVVIAIFSLDVLVEGKVALAAYILFQYVAAKRITLQQQLGTG